MDALETVDTVVYAGTGYGVYRTIDNGAQWSPFVLTDTAITSLINVNNILYAATPFGIYKLSDSDSEWAPAGLPDTAVYILAANESLIFAGTVFGVYVSDNGSRWILVKDGLEVNVTTLAINDNYLFAGTWGEKVWCRALPDISTGLEVEFQSSPISYVLEQNYPNPFNPVTMIDFILPKSEYTKLTVYNVLGKEVATLISRKLNSGNHSYTFNGSNLARGVYYYEIVAGDFRQVKKMILIKQFVGYYRNCFLTG